MLYNIIGDIHGRRSWKELVKDDCVNIFVGDYFSPYVFMRDCDKIENMLEIIEYKKAHPETILLIGNHDDQHWKNIDRMVSRFEDYIQEDIAKIFDDNVDMFQLAYSIENKALVTHAGVSLQWFNDVENKNEPKTTTFVDFDDHKSLDKYDNVFDAFNHIDHFEQMRESEDVFVSWDTVIKFRNKLYLVPADSNIPNLVKYTPDEVAKVINATWDSGLYSRFNFSKNASGGDYYGDSTTHGPLWIRPVSLIRSNIFMGTDILQFVGHTMNDTITTVGNVVFTDVLQYQKMSALYDTETNTVTHNISE